MLDKEQKLNKELTKFALAVAKLDAQSFIGVATYLKVPLFYNDPKGSDDPHKKLPRSGESIIEDCLVQFCGLNRKQRRDLIKLVTKAGNAAGAKR